MRAACVGDVAANLGWEILFAFHRGRGIETIEALAGDASIALLSTRAFITHDGAFDTEK